MYTQCPDCATAFRVTADILKQAAGKVRCGGCGNAFDALAYLSETKPAAPTPPDTDDEALPELTPELLEEPEEASPAPAISPEQSAALLKTLDELAGDDIRLEDTGVEWRLMSDDEDDEGDPEDEASAIEALQLSDDIDTPIDTELSDDLSTSVVDEHLDASPTHVDEFLTDTPNEVEAAEVFDELEDQVETADDTDEDPMSHELRFDDDTGLPGGIDNDAGEALLSFTDTAMPHQFEPEAQFVEPKEHVETQVDIVFGEPDDWGELLDEVADDDELAEELAEEPAEELADQLADEVRDESDDESEQQDEPIEVVIDDADDAESLSIEEELKALDDEDDARDDDQFVADLNFDEPEEDPDVLDAEFGELDDELDALDDELSLIDETITGDLDDELSEQILGALKDGLPEDAGPEISEHVILPETEEEQTINRMIDQDLLRLSVEDKDGTASTMALQEDELAGDADKKSATGINYPGFPSDISGVETIIMEGDFVRTALEQEALEAEAARAGKPDVKSFIEAAKQTFRGKMKDYDDDEPEDKPRSKYRIAAGVGLLGILLAGQVVHQTRADLVTIPVLNSVITPIYRVIGMPITPEWDVTGWRFEVTKGNTSGGDAVDNTGVDTALDGVADSMPDAEILTIFSRVGNKSSQALPYPLISVSLTDRFEETIGSKVLEPREYLAANIDATRLVQPGKNFNAVIPIESPSGTATGFKLNVCYRQAGGDLRCAVEDFK